VTNASRPSDADTERAWAFDALAGLSDGVIVVDRENRLVYHNAAAERLIGVGDELPADPETWPVAFGVYRSDETTCVPFKELPIVRALDGFSDRDHEIFVKNARVSGLHINCTSTPIREPNGDVRGAVCIFHDITARRRNEQELREGERQKKAILDNLPDMAWLKDQSGRFLAVNQPLAEAAGKRRPEECVGLDDFDLFPRELAARYRADDEEIMRTGMNKRVEEPFVDAAGRTYWIETIKTRILGDSGEVIGTTGIARDITDRKRNLEELERRVQERTAALAEAQEHLIRQERLAVLGQLAGGVAHQIRNPLAAIMNATYVLKRHVPPGQHPNVEDALRIIHDEVRHANVIITGLLDYARVRTPDRHPTSLAELVDRVLAADWIPPPIRVERVAAVDLPLLEVDADQLNGALTNLVRNAVEAMPDGGTLRVELRRVDDQVIIAVSDTGPGLSPQVRAHLFEPLQSTKPLGIGLGLVTARRFVEAHGGRIVYVDVPEGARFEIRLPLA
jgi:PAS domain S-box-containing protein